MASNNHWSSLYRTKLTRRRLLQGTAFAAADLASAAVFGCGEDGKRSATGAPTVTPRPGATTPHFSPTARPTSNARPRQFLPLSSPPPIPEPAAAPPPLAILNATIIDGTGTAPITDARVLISNRRIESVGPASGAPPDGYEVIDATGKTLMPGLVDGHVHITRQIVQVTPDLAASIVREGLLPFLQQGFTTLRDVGTATVVYSSISTLITPLSRDSKAPDIIWAGPIITTPGGYPFTNPRYTASGQDIVSPEEGASLVDQLADHNAGIIKIALERGFHSDEGWPVLSLDEVRAITAQAHVRGMLVTAHVTSLDELRLAIDGGVDNLAHTPLEAIPDDVIEEMVGGDMGIVTTATIWDPASALVCAENVRAFAEAGGRVSIGTDFGCCGQVAGIQSFLSEIQFLQGAGLTPAQLLVAATRGGAEVANVGATTGTIEAGKYADLVLLNADPLADLSALDNVFAVFKAGDRVTFSTS